MESIVYVKTYDAPVVNKKEILRYAGVKESTAEIDALISACLEEAEGVLSYKACYAEFPVCVFEERVDFGFASVQSKSLARHLKNCSRCVWFCATVGIGIDRLISKYSVISPTKALIFQAIGAERVESLCDLLNGEIAGNSAPLKSRFSPGYGDFPICFQKEIFSVLQCSKNVGVHLNESLFMSPSKSVTAVIGVCDGAENDERNECKRCVKTDCEYRNGL